MSEKNEEPLQRAAEGNDREINENDVPLTERVLRTAGTQKVGTILQESIPKLKQVKGLAQSHTS